MRIAIYSPTVLLATALAQALQFAGYKQVTTAGEMSFSDFLKASSSPLPDLMIVDTTGMSTEDLDRHRGAKGVGRFKSLGIGTTEITPPDFDLSISLSQSADDLVAAVRNLGPEAGPMILR